MDAVRFDSFSHSCILAFLFFTTCVSAQDPSACLVNWQITVDQASASGTLQTQQVDACVVLSSVTFLNVFLWFGIWFSAVWFVMLSTQSC